MTQFTIVVLLGESGNDSKNISPGVQLMSTWAVCICAFVDDTKVVIIRQAITKVRGLMVLL
jgi:hypothetical protein